MDYHRKQNRGLTYYKRQYRGPNILQETLLDALTNRYNIGGLDEDILVAWTFTRDTTAGLAYYRRQSRSPGPLHEAMLEACTIK